MGSLGFQFTDRHCADDNVLCRLSSVTVD